MPLILSGTALAAGEDCPRFLAQNPRLAPCGTAGPSTKKFPGQPQNIRNRLQVREFDVLTLFDVQCSTGREIGRGSTVHLFKRAADRYYTSTTRKRVSPVMAGRACRRHTRLRVVLVFSAFGWPQRCSQQWIGRGAPTPQEGAAPAKPRSLRQANRKRVRFLRHIDHPPPRSVPNPCG